uniref:NLRP3 n=1 Tax=Buteo japonicus TaxID=224669 RepID=A0A8B9Z8H0_9AVES
MAGEERALAVLLQALQDLAPKDFQEFKTKLSEVHVEGGWNIPKDSLAKAAHPSALVSCVGKNYSEDAAMDIAIGLFEEMNQRDLAEKLLDEKVKEYKQKYREHVVREFLRYKEVNSCLGKNLSVKSRYTALTIARKPRSKHGGEHEAVATITVTAQTLFKADEDGQTPQVVVLVGAPGMGKTMTVRKVMVEWVEGTAYAQFDYVFCIDCKDVAFTEEASVADLVSKCCPHRQMPAGKILDDQKKILFIFDGFEALGFSLVQPEDELSSDPREVKPLETTLMSLLKKTVLPESSLLITTRPTALQSLGQCLEGEYYAEILGFSAAMREEYFHRYFENDNKANTAFSFARGNKILYSLCVIPVMSWTICTILEQELNKKKNLTECSKATTQMSVFYLSRLMKCRDRDNPQDLQQFLRKLCSLAADGIWKHKVLFEEKEIKDHSLDQPDLLPLFLNEKISKKGVDHGNVYSFTHLHLQEFFAAMFYVLEDDEEMVDDAGALVKDVNMLLESYSESRKDLNLTVRFLFGLVSQKSVEYANEIIGCRISSRAREDMLRWLQGRPRGISHPGQALKVSELDTFHFLFEMNEKSFVQSALGHFTEIDLQDIRLTLYDQMALSFCLRQWVGLEPSLSPLATQNHKGFSFSTPKDGFKGISAPSTQTPACPFPGGLVPQQRILLTLGENCGRIRIVQAPLSAACGGIDGDGASRLNFPGPNSPICAGVSVWLGSCRLTGACCRTLAARLVESPRLTCLDLSDNELGADGVLQLCQQLRHPACPLQALGLSTSGLNEDVLQELAALRALKPDLKIGYLLEQDAPQPGAMARLPFNRGVLPGTGGPGGRKALPSCRRGPCNNRSRF